MLATQKGRSKPVRISSRRWLKLILPPEASAAIVLEMRRLKVGRLRSTDSAGISAPHLRRSFDRDVRWLESGGQEEVRQSSLPLPHPVCFSQVFILKRVKVVCFDTLLQVLILKGLALHQNCAKCGPLPQTVFILKGGKVVCFGTVLEVLIPRELECTTIVQNEGIWRG